MVRATLITGSDGYLGSRVTKALLESTDAQLFLWLRASSSSEFEQKKNSMTDILDLRSKDLRRVEFYSGNLTEDGCFATIDPTVVSNIIHLAAVTRFNVDEETARSVNLEGTSRVIEFARNCRNLERLCHVSTVYASGKRSGVIDEEPVTGSDGFANHYERSKWAAEAELIDKCVGIPWSIVRVATVLADDVTGHVSQHNAVHNTLKLLYYGLLSVIPGDASTPLYLVTGEFAADAVIAVLRSGEDSGVYNAAYKRSQCITLGDFVDTAFATFETDSSFKKRRILKPLYADVRSFSMLSEAVTGFGDGIMKQAVSSVSPFAEQLFIDKDVKNDRLLKILPHYSPPDARDLVAKTCQYLIQTKWGRASEVVSS